jgi:hypothetical protein
MTRQAIDHRDGSHNGVGLDIDLKTLVGSQSVPYIYEDYVKNENVALGIMKMYELSDVERQNLSRKVFNYARSEFSFQKTVDDWHNTASNLVENWKKNRKTYSVQEF